MEWIFFVLVMGIVIFVIYHSISEHRRMKRVRQIIGEMRHDVTSNWINSLPRYDDRFFAHSLRNALRITWEPKLHNWKKEGF